MLSGENKAGKANTNVECDGKHETVIKGSGEAFAAKGSFK